MSALKEALRHLRSDRPKNLRVPEIAQTARVAEAIAATADGSDAPKPNKNYDLVAAEILAKARSAGELTRREAREAAWCLWETEPKLAEDPDALMCLTEATEASKRKQPFRALASSYITSYDPTRPALDIISELLVRLAPGMGQPWAPLQSELDLFHAVHGPQNLARVAVERGMSPTGVLSGYGLGAVNAQSGLAKFCIAVALEQMRDGGEPRHDVRLEWVKTFALRNERELLFHDHGPLVADALLIPFGSDMPPEATVDRFLALLIRLFGDPRLHPARWARMREAAAIVRRWLTKQSLRQFFDVVDQVAVERMWKYRRAFWEAAYRQQLISDAWVVFCYTGSEAAKRAFGREISFATFDGTVTTGQAVLLLCIGRGVVAEWSHTGKCIIWHDADARDAPVLHQARYRPASLRAPVNASQSLDSPVFAISHIHPESYYWQTRVAEKLHQMTGVRIGQNSYQVN